MKEELFCSRFCGVMGDWNQCGIGFLKQLYCLFESIDQAFSKPHFFPLIPGGGFSNSVAASLLTLTIKTISL